MAVCLGTILNRPEGSFDKSIRNVDIDIKFADFECIAMAILEAVKEKKEM